MISEMKLLYDTWNKNQLQLDDHEDFILVTTPFLDLHHDFLQLIFTKNGAEEYRLSDDGFVLSELEMLGIDIFSSQKRKSFFDMTLRIFGVTHNRATGELSVSFKSLSEYPKKQNNLIQCLLRVSDMLLTARNTVIGIFAEEVSNYFIENQVFFSDDIGYTGKSGNYQSFDFVIPAARGKKEKIIKAINNPKADNYKQPLLSFVDIQELKPNSQFIVLGNDSIQPISETFYNSLSNYQIQVLPWSERDRWVGDLRIL
ncbi:DUF1829 domain-containing protein [Sporosarcina sp. ITBMC105]